MVKQRKKATELERIAYHEAGHAVMAYILRRRFHSITIDPEKLDDNTGGLVRLVHSNKLSRTIYTGCCIQIERQIRIILAGEVACGLFIGQKNWDISQDDAQISFRLAGLQCGCEVEANAYLEWLLLSVQNHLKLPHNWICVCVLAKELMQQKTLSYRKAREIIKSAHDKYILQPTF